MHAGEVGDVVGRLLEKLEGEGGAGVSMGWSRSRWRAMSSRSRIAAAKSMRSSSPWCRCTRLGAALSNGVVRIGGPHAVALGAQMAARRPAPGHQPFVPEPTGAAVMLA